MCSKTNCTPTRRFLTSHSHLVVLLLLSFQGGLTALTNDDVSGPVVKLGEDAGDKNSNHSNAGEDTVRPSETFAQLLDQALQKEFVDETTKSEGKKRTGYNATVDDVSFRFSVVSNMLLHSAPPVCMLSCEMRKNTDLGTVSSDASCHICSLTLCPCIAAARAVIEAATPCTSAYSCIPSHNLGNACTSQYFICGGAAGM